MVESSEFTFSSDARERLHGALAFFERVLNDDEFREQLPDEAIVATLGRSGEATFPSGSEEARVLYAPDRGEAIIFEGEHARIAATKPSFWNERDFSTTELIEFVENHHLELLFDFVHIPLKVDWDLHSDVFALGTEDWSHAIPLQIDDLWELWLVTDHKPKVVRIEIEDFLKSALPRRPWLTEMFALASILDMPIAELGTIEWHNRLPHETKEATMTRIIDLVANEAK